jgi:tetratricopeptide (TPR) repeat protein
LQEGPAGGGFGRLLDGTLREVLVGACQLRHGGLVVLTSRFPFADLETFDGDRARILDMPPFTPAEGSALLAAAGGDWLADSERRALVRAVEGHALAVGVLAGLLDARPPASDLDALQRELVAAARTDARVGRVLRFYADRLSEPDRYLLAAVSLFARPVPAAAVLTVARHEEFARHLAGWTPAMVQAAVRDRLGGQAIWHPNGTISAHPLVRDTFRPLVMDAAEAAAETSLTGMPAKGVTSRADALRVVEVIELLLDAGLWHAADDLFGRRTSMGKVFQSLPAARLGLRAGIAFVGTPARREDIATALTPDNLPYYLNLAGINATAAGDLLTAQEYLRAAVQQCRDYGETNPLSTDLQNLTECLGNLGEIGPAQEAATEALTCAELGSVDRDNVLNSHALLGWLAGMSGDHAESEKHFTASDQIALARDKKHLSSLYGTRWADWLARTGRTGPAQELTRRNRETCKKNHWNDALAGCDKILGRLALAAGDTETAGERLAAAATCFRAGDYLTELATTLADLAEHARLSADLDTAEMHAAEAISIAAPRCMVPAQSSGLAARARICADRGAANAGPDHLARGRDAAEAALRLATRHHLAWHELDALRAHAALDHAEGTDRGWAARADALHVRLVPPGLDPDPLATVERPVAVQKPAPKVADQKTAQRVAAQRAAKKSAKAVTRRRRRQRRSRPRRK